MADRPSTGFVARTGWLYVTAPPPGKVAIKVGLLRRVVTTVRTRDQPKPRTWESGSGLGDLTDSRKYCSTFAHT